MRALVVGVLCAVAMVTGAQAAIKEEPVTYSDGQTTMKGFLVYDDAVTGKRPGIIMVHEWWGITPHIHNEAKKFAEQGYTALIADMYGDAKTADNPKDAGALAGGVMKDPAAMQSRFKAAQALLGKHATVNPQKIGAVGYCFGGAVVLNMARSGLDLKAVASFHGALGTQTPAQPGKVKAKIRVFTGADDKMIPPAQVAAFKEEMARAGVDFQVTEYPGAMHAFTNPDADALGKKFDMPIAYNATADQDSWQQATAFLKATLMPAK